MSKYNNQSAIRIDPQGFNRRVEAALGLSRGDPSLKKEYISPVGQGRFSVIGKLENSVSMLQTARMHVNKIKGWLEEMKEFLENDRHHSLWANIPVSIVNNFLADRLLKIKAMTETAGFQGKMLFNGDSGVKGEVTGDHLRFVRGSARVISSESPGYPLTIYQSPKPATLVGLAQVNQMILEEESFIAITDGSQEVRYHVKDDENSESLVMNLQRCLTDHGMDISVFRTKDDHLFFRHNQLGSRTGFQGMSYHTRLLSGIPGQYRSADPGIDIAGTISSESAHGDGGFLMGDKGNKRTDGLAVFFDGQVEYAGQIVGYVHTQQNGIIVPLDATESEMEILSIPALLPEQLAVGVSNQSGFLDLGMIRGNTECECRDSLKLILWSLTYLEFIQDELKWKEKIYVERAVEMLRSTISHHSADEEMLYLSKEKAKDMVSQLRTMLTPATAMNVTNWR
ncbi:hypothetical protein KKA14_20660 [bacterium]|nr:hypothetical protein [bacterium]